MAAAAEVPGRLQAPVPTGASEALTAFPPLEPPAGPSGIDPNVATERTARLEMADALDLSEHLVGKEGRPPSPEPWLHE